MAHKLVWGQELMQWGLGTVTSRLCFCCTTGDFPGLLPFDILHHSLISHHFVVFCGAGHWGRRGNKLASIIIEMYVSRAKRPAAQVPKTASNKGDPTWLEVEDCPDCKCVRQ